MWASQAVCTSVSQSGCSPGRGDIQEGSETDLQRQLSGKMEGGGGASEGVDGSVEHSCQLHVAWNSALCHKRRPVSTTAVYMHARSIFKDKSISVHLRTH